MQKIVLEASGLTLLIVALSVGGSYLAASVKNEYALPFELAFYFCISMLATHAIVFYALKSSATSNRLIDYIWLATSAIGILVTGTQHADKSYTEEATRRYSTLQATVKSLEDRTRSLIQLQCKDPGSAACHGTANITKLMSVISDNYSVVILPNRVILQFNDNNGPAFRSAHYASALIPSATSSSVIDMSFSEDLREIDFYRSELDNIINLGWVFRLTNLIPDIGNSGYFMLVAALALRFTKTSAELRASLSNSEKIITPVTKRSWSTIWILTVATAVLISTLAAVSVRRGCKLISRRK